MFLFSWEVIRCLGETTGSSIIIILSLAYSLIVRENIYLLACVNVGGEGQQHSILIMNNAIHCWQQEHTALLLSHGMIGLVWTIGFPVSVLLMM